MAAVVRRNVARLRTAALDLQAAMETRSVARAKRLVYGAKKERKTIEDTLEYIEMDLVVATGDTVEQPLCIREAARELLSLADALAGLAAYVDAEGLAGQPPPGRQADVDRLDALHYQLDLAVSTSTALLQLVVPALSDAAQQSHIVTAAAEVAHASGAALLAIHSAHERSAAWQASDHAMFAELMDEWAEHQCQLVCQLLAAGDGGKGVQPAAADAAAQAWSPANLAAWLRAVTPVLDAIAASLGLAACSFVAPLGRLLGRLVQAKSARLQPHIQAFVADWPLVEGCIRLLTACHEALVAAPGWQEGLPYGQACDWGGKHEALVVDWALAWPHLLAHAEAAGRQQEALALLALAASTTLSGEAQLLASMLLQLPQPASVPQTEAEEATTHHQTERLKECWTESIAAVGRVGLFLIQPAPHLPAAGSRRAWPAFRQLASTSTAVLRYCGQAQLPAGTYHKVIEAVNCWLTSAGAMCRRLSQQGEPAAASADEQREQAAAAATLTNSLLRLLRLLPQLVRALNGCQQTADCRCSLCGSVRFAYRINTYRLLHALVTSLDGPGRSALAGQQAPGAASLARLFSACTSVCHFLAGLEGEELAICFAPPRSAHSPGVVAAVAAGMAVEVAKVPQAVLHLLWPALLASRPTEAGGEAARQWDRQYVCALLEATAALAAIEGLAHKSPTGPAVRPSVLHTLHTLCLAGGSDQGSRAAAADAVVQVVDEAATLAGLQSHLLDPAAAEALPQLLQRVLQPAEAGSIAGSTGPPAALPPVSAEAAILQAEALGSRKLCSYLRCPNLAAPGSSRARGKLCARCRCVRYDSVSCQRQDFFGAGGVPHKQACAALAVEAADAADTAD